MEENEMYEKVCNPKIDGLEKKVDKLCDGLFGTIDRPGMANDLRIIKNIFNENPTLIDDVKTFKKLYKCSVGAMGFLIVTIIGQFFIWLRSKFS